MKKDDVLSLFLENSLVIAALIIAANTVVVVLCVGNVYCFSDVPLMVRNMARALRSVAVLGVASIFVYCWLNTRCDRGG